MNWLHGPDAFISWLLLSYWTNLLVLTIHTPPFSSYEYLVRSTNYVTHYTALSSLGSLHPSYTFRKCVHSTEHIFYTVDTAMYMLKEVKWSLVTHTHYDRKLFILNMYHANTSVIPEITSCVQTQHSHISN